jgi:DNA/RNA endonuclease YhcR with UshA esterase domain
MNHNVEILGYIVSKYTHYNRTSLVVDDGSGLITCNLWISSDKRDIAHTIYQQEFALGQLVNIQGRIAFFKNEIRITIQHIRILGVSILASLHPME